MKVRLYSVRIVIALGVVVIVAAALNVIPLGTYTSTGGCPATPTPKQRLGLMKGQTLQQVKDRDANPSPYHGCSLNTHYTQYLLF